MINGKLLWVDDEIEMLKAYRIFLENKGYEVVCASNGNDAIELCREGSFDLILLDENMSGLSGLETLSRIKEIRPDVPVVMVTKNEEEDIMNQAIGAKIADYLIKPVNPNQILLALKKNIHRREIVSEVAESSYRSEFGRIGMQLSEYMDFDGWKELYKKLVFWELELAETGGAMAEMIQMQKEEANQNFAKFIRRNYEGWFSTPEGRPLMSMDLMKTTVFPRLSAGKKIFLIVLDNLRFDQWRTLARELKNDFDIDEDLYLSILPTAT
ncbi:MAG: response regulator, partial [Bacteroidaceae bacterium]|nr:response regulator [Bacteroidaceae bacterium]